VRYEEWTDKDGNKRTGTRIRVSGPNSRLVMLGGRPDGGSRRGAAAAEPSPTPPADDYQVSDDDVPF
jgi:single-stranded DNA-binding protein